MTAKPNVVMANDWCVWVQDVADRIVVVTKSYVDHDVQFAAVVFSRTGKTDVGAVRRPKAGPPVTFDIPVTSSATFTFVEMIHDLTKVGDIAEFRSVHEYLAGKAGHWLEDVCPEGTA